MTTTYLAYKIDGKAHENHEISIEQLIESLKGFSQSVQEAHKLLNGDDAEELAINVVAFNEGSFKAIFQVVTNVKDQFDALSFLGFKESVQSNFTNVIQGLRNINGREFEIQKNDDGTCTVTVDNQQFTTSKEVAVSFKNLKIRNGLDKLLAAPLGAEGTDFVSLSLYDATSKEVLDDSETVVTLSEFVAFQANPPNMNDDASTIVSQQIVSFTKINFAGPSGWTVKLGSGKKVAARMEDVAFLTKMSATNAVDRQAFRSDDLFEVQIKHTKTSNKHSKKVSNSYIVETVLHQITDKGANKKT